jgi:hypothetical protein
LAISNSVRGGQRRLSLPFKPSARIDDEGRRGGEWRRLIRSPATTKRGVLVQRKVGTDAIVIVGIGFEDLAQMDLAQDQDMVQAFSPDRADEPFGVSVLPG